ncbi:MAG: ABC transporter ATP-binding protein [Planctomycetota bacterium]
MTSTATTPVSASAGATTPAKPDLATAASAPLAPAKNWSELTIHLVPPAIVQTLEAAGLGLRHCRLCVPSRVLLNGQYGESWLALSPDAIAIVAENGHGPELLWRQATADLTGIRTQPVTGGGVMVVDVKGQPREVLRFDAGQAPLFGGIAQKLNKHLAPKKTAEVPVTPAPDSTAPAPADAMAAVSPAASAPIAPGLPAPTPVAPAVPHAPRDGSAAADEPEPEPLDFQELLAKQRELHCPKCQRLYPKNTKVCPFCVPRSATLRRILQFAGECRNDILYMGALMILGTGLGLINPLLMRQLVDHALNVTFAKGHLKLVAPIQYNELAWVVAEMFGLLVAGQVINILRARTGIRVGTTVTNSIQKKAYFHLQTLSMSYFNRQQTGSLMSRINNDARQMQGFLSEGIQFTVVNFLQIIGVAVVMFCINPFLAMLVVLPAPLMIFLSAWVWRRVHRRFALLWSAMAAVTSYLNDALSGIRVIKAFGQEALERERFDQKVTTSRDRWIEAEQTWQTFIPLLNFIASCSGLLIWYFGGRKILDPHDTFTLGDLFAFTMYLGMITGPLQLMTRLNDWLTRSLTAAARVFEVLDAEPDIVEKPGAVAMPACQGRIEFREVSFGYEKHRPVLMDVSLAIQPGEMIGLVGPSGAGKSTIINIIGRLYDVDEGGLYIDGVNIKDIKLDDLRRHVGYVLQDNFLFNGSVAQNIAYARPEATREEIIAASIAANAHSFILNLPDGYDTLCGERGDRLSGGERQRISIARAILHDPKILIMDEATSSVDTETEARIQMAMANLIQGRTTIAIAHRLSTLRHAHRLIVIEDGKVAESGTHDELMAKEGGVYRKLVTIQTEWSRQIGVGG